MAAPARWPSSGGSATAPSREGAGSALHPREPLGFPAAKRSPVAIGIEWPLESVRHVSAAGITHRCHRPCGTETSAARAAYEEQFVFFVCADVCERCREPVNERRVQLTTRKILPLNQNRPLPEGG